MSSASQLPVRARLLACLLLASLASWTLTATTASPIASTSSLSDSSSSPRSFPITRRKAPKRTGDKLVSWANNHRAHLRTKYGLASKSKSTAASKRTEGSASLVNFEDDSTWYTAVDIGTPSKAYNLVLDTGSADIWIARTNYTPSDSSSFTNKSSTFSIEYGSGDVAGYMATETFTLAGHTITGQEFAVATDVSSDLEDGTTVGIVGLGFQALSTSGAEPIWSSAGETEFAFYLERDSSTTTTVSSGGDGNGGFPGGTIPGVSKRATTDTSSGGIFTLGGANTSLYQGDINWSNVIDKTYWLITLGGVTSQGSTVDIGTYNKAAIDTGTTLIGGPDDIIENLYSQISGSSAISGADGYYQFPCSSTINATLTFGNQQYTLNSTDFSVSEVDSSGEYCMGSFFSVGSVSTSSELQWIVGDAFLKSVYSVFSDGDTARVGFATLADGLGSGSSTSTTVAQTKQASGGALASVVSSKSLLLSCAVAAVGVLLL